jgi:iron complex transport system substrate-binding protein
MKRRFFLKFILLILASMVMLMGSCRGPVKKETPQNAGYHRIISFAPSITETLFALGMGDRVVGVTRYCLYPAQVKQLPQVGGFLDQNFEMILTLKPDLVLLLKEHGTLIDFLKKNSITYKSINNENMAGILQSFDSIGVWCGKKVSADSLVNRIKQEIVDTVSSIKRPRVLLCIGRDNAGSGSITKIYAAGPRTFYHELLLASGGENVYQDSAFAYPSMSGEGIVRLAPDVIIDIMAGSPGLDTAVLHRDWNVLSMVPAVKNQKVFCLAGDYLTIPGPRIVQILKDFKLILHSGSVR